MKTLKEAIRRDGLKLSLFKRQSIEEAIDAIIAVAEKKKDNPNV